ncbi:Protein of unknown function DUF72 [Seminavis robusta]|uniref:DUF72 domain-containing protein n=1 Tax=Seminavis robusta TaxID=568900 RepID=A0A9N8HL38_9STRA|nr:Protein of unknown function DUF72 [Seminavis robusta]|eukprot:Sro796_g203710.1 Protein of unknown function DUF72 (392) ;mRNA; f:15052-16227
MRRADEERWQKMMNNDNNGSSVSSLSDVYIGTAGYSYAHWRQGVFYPGHTTQNQELRHYSGIFPTVEINASFHGVPRLETLQSWAQKSKDGFVFSFKVPQAVTHESRLENIQEALTFFLQRLQEGIMPNEKVGPILFQLPPSLPKNIDRLNEIAALVAPHNNNNLRVAFEFRHASWYNDPDVNAVMKRHNFAMCQNISPDNSTLRGESTTASWHYMRCHKRADRLVTQYTDEQLDSLAEEMVARRKRGLVQYCYFLNDHEGNGPRNAKTLMRFIQQRTNNNKSALVHNWKPDPTETSITSLFAKQQQTNDNDNQSAPTKAIISSPTSSSKRKTRETPKSKATTKTLHSFFSPADTSQQPPMKATPSKRPKLVANNNAMKKKGQITDFFAKK